MDLSELSRLAGPVPRFKFGSGGDGIGTSGHVEVGDGGRTGVNGGFESSLKFSSLSRSSPFVYRGVCVPEQSLGFRNATGVCLVCPVVSIVFSHVLRLFRWKRLKHQIFS